MRGVAEGLQSVAATLWVGGMWAIGFIVAPALFATVPDRTLAGLLAGKLFSLMAWIGVLCAVCLIAFHLMRHRSVALRQAQFWLVIVMLVLVLVGEFGLQPAMAVLRQQALPLPVMDSALRGRFATLHGVASGFYVIQCVLGAALIILRGRIK